MKKLKQLWKELNGHPTERTGKIITWWIIFCCVVLLIVVVLDR